MTDIEKLALVSEMAKKHKDNYKAISEPYNHQTTDYTKKTNSEILKDFCGEKKKEEGVDTKELLRFYNYYELKCDKWSGEFKVEELYKRWYDGRKKAN